MLPKNICHKPSALLFDKGGAGNGWNLSFLIQP